MYDCCLETRVSFTAGNNVKATYGATTIWVFPTLIALTPLIRGTLIPTGRNDTVSDESNIVSEPFCLAQLILLQAREALLRRSVIIGSAEDCGRPIAFASHILAPGASFATSPVWRLAGHGHHLWGWKTIWHRRSLTLQ